MPLLHLVWLIASVTVSDNVLFVAAAGCSITLPIDIPSFEPVYFLTTPSEPQPKLFRPTGEVTTLPVGAQLTLACVGSGNNLELLGQQSLVLTCRNDGSFYSSEKSKTFYLDQLSCLRIPASELDLTSNTCGGSSTAHYYEAGYKWHTYFGSVFTICYDNSTETTLYTRNIINGAVMDYAISESTRRAFGAEGMRFSTTAVNKYYKQSTQLDRFKSLFGTKHSYITKTSFFARGHLTPDADFVFRYEQLATYFYANVAPEFQVVNAGNWLRVENAARGLARKFNSDLLTFNGILGVLKLTDSKNALKSINLDATNFFPAPQWYYKVLMHPKLDTSLVMITLNNPFAEIYEIEEFCPNVCEKYGLALPFYADTTRGYTFCCTLEDFQVAVPDLPTFDLPAGW